MRFGRGERMPLEERVRPVPGIAKILADFSGLSAANAVIAFVFAASAPIAIILGVGSKGGLSEAEMASWIFGSFFLNGLLSIALSLLYRQPLVFFWTIPGTVLVGPALGHLSFGEVVGAFYATGLLLLVLGLSGWVRRIMVLLPMPIVMAMVAGVFLRFGLEWLAALGGDFWIAMPMTAAFFLLSMHPAIARRLPPMIGVLLVGIIAVWASGRFAPDIGSAVMMARPVVFAPVFSWPAMVELVIPLAVTVLAAQNAQGIAILTASGHRPPVNMITTACGVTSLVTAVTGTVSTCLTGPVNAILSSGGEPARQYTGAVLVGMLALLFGLFAPLFTHLMLATPPAFIATLAGLALLRVLLNAFVISFSARFTLGALISFLVTLADHAIFNIGAPFWGLLFGLATAWLLERDDFGGDGANR